jgi:hypothetical protein
MWSFFRYAVCWLSDHRDYRDLRVKVLQEPDES